MAMKKTPVRRGRERRGSERADVRLSMRVEAAAVAGSSKIVTESQNISSSGVYCHASHYLAPLSKVQLTIVLPRTPGREPGQELVKCEGIVVRCDQGADPRSETPYELACMFTGLEPTLRHRVADFVTWRNLQALRAVLAAPVKQASRAKQPPARTALRKAVPRRTAARPAAKRVAATSTSRATPKAPAAPKRTARKAARKSVRRASR